MAGSSNGSGGMKPGAGTDIKKAVRPSGDRSSFTPYFCERKLIMAFQLLLFKEPKKNKGRRFLLPSSAYVCSANAENAVMPA